mgnify:CR=1 FL=1
MNARGIEHKAKIIVSLLKLINTNKANKHRVEAYNKPSLTEILPEAIGLFFVLDTFLSNSLSTISLMIHPADLIKTEPKKNKPWKGRFQSNTDPLVDEFTASVHFDQILASHDILGSKAHVTMLKECGIINNQECKDILTGLETIQKEIKDGQFDWNVSLEDVHMNIESRLVEIIGETGKKLHTARSRNDQVATDLRLYARTQVDELLSILTNLINEIVTLAEKEAFSIMPGFTHLQVAQPVTMGHHLLAWAEMILRDIERLIDCRKRINVLPLGSGALAGTTFKINREITARLLEFEHVSENSMDAVSDRDFVIELISTLSLTMIHFSRICEELIIWSSQQFNFIEISDEYCTGSSMMPQKKNPDVPELIRGKSGRVIGSLISIITIMKSQPLCYNKDNQEDKEPLFDAVNTTRRSAQILSSLIPQIEVKQQNLLDATKDGFILATDIADHLVRKGTSFRDAHELTGKIVRKAIKQTKKIEELTLEEFQDISPVFDESIYETLSIEQAVNARNHTGGTAPSEVVSACSRMMKRLKKLDEKK